MCDYDVFCLKLFIVMKLLYVNIILIRIKYNK